MSSSLTSLTDDRIDICDLIQMNQISAVNITATQNASGSDVSELHIFNCLNFVIIENNQIYLYSPKGLHHSIETGNINS